MFLGKIHRVIENATVTRKKVLLCFMNGGRDRKKFKKDWLNVFMRVIE